MSSEDNDVFDDGGGGARLGGSSVACSICLEAVIDDGKRSRAKLQCGHEFHLDCIGSAFNAKGVMQCPNCRKIEKGHWLYANGCRSLHEFSVDDWTHDEDLYDLSYSELPFGVHWCPFSGLTRVPTSFEEGDPPSAAYHDLLGHHAIFSEHTAASSTAHSCPYVAYYGPIQPLSSHSGDNVSDGPNLSHQWNGLIAPSEVSANHEFHGLDLHFHSWDHHSPPFSPTSNRSGFDQTTVPPVMLRSARNDSDGMPRSGSLLHPFLPGHGSGHRAGTSAVSSVVPPYPGSSARSRERMQGLHAHHQQQQLSNLPNMRTPIFSGVRRPNGGSRGVAPVGQVPSSSDSAGGFYIFPPPGPQEAENRHHFYAWERDRFAPFPLIPVDRDSGWGSFHQVGSAADSGSRSNSFWQRHGSERTSSQGRADNSAFQPVHPTGRMLPFI